MSKLFSSKVILFGEYGVIKGSQALIVPFEQFKGKLEVTNLDVDQSLWSFGESIKKSRILRSVLDIARFENDLKSGLRFISSIPQGMGLGSSGALCAAVFDEYKKDNSLAEDVPLLQEYLSIMEAHFHGKSSGIDPLVSYMDKTLYIKADQSVEVAAKPLLKHFGNFYLYNSQIQRQTAPLVHHFLKDYADPSLKEPIDRYMDLSDLCIKNIFDFDKESFLENFIEISKLQFEFFSKMIPQHIQKVWRSGLDSGKYFFKLCGAGGGGFFICYSTSDLDFENLTLIS